MDTSACAPTETISKRSSATGALFRVGHLQGSAEVAAPAAQTRGVARAFRCDFGWSASTKESRAGAHCPAVSLDPPQTPHRYGGWNHDARLLTAAASIDMAVGVSLVSGANAPPHRLI